jgi:S-formylglutathione hydrolase FrmB
VARLLHSRRPTAVAAVALAVPAVALSVASAAPTAVSRAARPTATAGPFAACQRPGAHVVVGRVTCRREPAPDLGGTTAFSYYVPPGCAPRLHRRCPTLYDLHGFGGDLTSMLGTAGSPSAYVAALTCRPRVAPGKDPHPWGEADPAAWVHARALDMVLVAPDGRTVPGGYGPAPLLESFWTDWNPRYAEGGADPKYRTPPPRFAAYLVHELIPYVQAHFPVGRGRDYRALDGESLGGFGSYSIGLAHPDEFASVASVSGIMDILLVHGITRPTPQTPLHTLTVPSTLGGTIPLGLTPAQARGFLVVLEALGDPASDAAYYRGRMPVDLARNAHARHGRRQSVALRAISNDTLPRRVADFASPQDYATAQAFEDLVFVTTKQMNHAFALAKVRQHYELHPGIHSSTYWNPWVRAQLAAQYARVRHWDGGGSPPPRPTRFDYRSTAKQFSVWGWRLAVHRLVPEFLTLSGVSCNAARG